MDAPSFEKRKTKLPIFTFSELISATLRLYGQNFSGFILPVALVTVPTVMISAAAAETMLKNSELMNTYSANPSSMTREQAMQMMTQSFSAVGSTASISLILGLIQSIVVMSLITWFASESYFGRTASLGEAIRSVFQRFWSLVGGLLFYNLILIAITIALAFTLFLCGLGIGLIFFISITLGSLVIPVFLLERTGFGLGLRRSWYLAKRRFWMLFGVLALVTVSSFVVNLGLGGLTRNVPTVSIIVQSLLAFIVVPFGQIANTLIYYDARVRYEDLEGALNSAEKQDARPADVDSPVYNSSLMDGSDFTNVAILTVLMIVIVLVIVGLNLALGNPGYNFR